ncbi:hypothetical protein FRC02_004162 [Tulasnella sp. 418]|nr:hypothetical protein FRC02_004162 [Tulasnella sp. 418]
MSTPPPPDRNSRVSQTQHIIKQSLSQSPQSSRPAPRRPVPSEEPVSKKRRQTTGTAAAPRVSFNLTAPTVTPRRKVSASQPPILSDRDEDTSTSVIRTPPRRRSLTSEDKQGTPFPNPPIDPAVSQSTPSSTPRVLSHRHPDFWFLDGSIVLRLGKTVFRVHKSQMVSKSPFFIDLFHEETSEMMDGCPVYELPSDMNITVLDFSRLLKANYNAFKYIRKSPSFQILSSLLRASVAFKFEDIKEWALEEFKRMWDSDVKAVKGKRPHARESVVLARAVKGLADKVLKPALYEIIKMPRLGMDVLEDGESFPGSSRTEVIDVDASDDEESQVDTLGHQLTWNDIGRLVYAREQMAMEWNRYALRATSNCKAHIPVATPLTCPNQNEPTPPIAETPKTRECGEYFRSQWPELVHESGIFEDHLHDPIGGLSELLEVSANWEKNRVWCSSCATSNRQHWKKGKEKLWDCLDVWLELGN